MGFLRNQKINSKLNFNYFDNASLVADADSLPTQEATMAEDTARTKMHT